MAFNAGKDGAIYVTGYDLSSYFNKMSIEVQPTVLDTSGFGTTAKTFIGGQIDGKLSAEGMFDGSASAIDAVLEPLLGADSSIVSMLPAADSEDAVAYCTSGAESSYDVTSPVADLVSVTVEAQQSGGLDRCVVLTPLDAKSSSTSSTGNDGGASTTDGGAGYIHCTADSSLTSIDVVIEHADDAGFTTNKSTIVTFTQITASPTSERIAVTGTVRRYVRAAWTLVGTSATIHVSFFRG